MTSDDPSLTPSVDPQPPRRISGLGSKRLYLGETELLQLENLFYVERCRRFAYADIQFLLLRQTARGLVWSFVLGVLAAGFGTLAWSADDGMPRAILAGLAGTTLLLLTFNLARGTTCTCHLRTAVGLAPLPSLRRMRAARRALALLSERVAATQGTLASAEASAQVDKLSAQRS